MSEHPFQHRGGCECGAVSFVYHCSQPLTDLVARACQCEFCLPRGASYLSEADARLQVQFRNGRYIYAHSFGTNTADFMHCAVCNTLVYVKSEIDGRDYALVVATALLEYELLDSQGPVDYAGEELTDRLQRRAEHWISHLEVAADDS